MSQKVTSFFQMSIFFSIQINGTISLTCQKCGTIVDASKTCIRTCGAKIVEMPTSYMARAQFHAFFTWCSFPLSCCAKHHLVCDNERRLQFLQFAIIFLPLSLTAIFVHGAADRYDKTHARSFRAAPPICGDTFSFFFYSFSPLSFLLTLSIRDNRNCKHSRDFWERFIYIQVYVTGA